MEHATALPAPADETGLTQHVEVLSDRLPGRAYPVAGRKPAAELEQRLVVPVLEFVKQGATSRVGKRLVDVGHEAER